MLLLWTTSTTGSACGHTTIIRLYSALRKTILLEEMEEIKIDMTMPLGDDRKLCVPLDGQSNSRKK